MENYKLLPETGPRYQLIQGDPYLAPAPNRFHQEISRNLEFELHGYLKHNSIGKLFHAPFDVYLDEINVFQPDIDVVLNERLGILTEKGAEGAPDLVVEILSPKTRRLDLVNKKQGYARAGVKELWIIDPEPRTVTMHSFNPDASEMVIELDENRTLTSPLLPGWSLSGSALTSAKGLRPRAKERQGTQRITFGDEHLKTNFKSITSRTSARRCVMLRAMVGRPRRRAFAAGFLTT